METVVIVTVVSLAIVSISSLVFNWLISRQNRRK